MQKLFFLFFLSLCLYSQETVDEVKFVKEIYGQKLNEMSLDILDKHCMHCHEEETQKGDVNLEPLFGKLEEVYQPLWQRVLEVINDKSMPPKPNPKKKKKKKMVKVTNEEREVITSSLDASILSYYDSYRKINGGFGNLRRIANYEFLKFLKNNFNFPTDTVKDLLPNEDNQLGFNNDTEFLRMSDRHYSIYKEVIEKVGNYVVGRSYSPDKVIEVNFKLSDAGKKNVERRIKSNKIETIKKIEKEEKEFGSAKAHQYFNKDNYDLIGPQYSKREGYRLLGGNNKYRHSFHEVSYKLPRCSLELGRIPQEGVYEITIKARVDFAKEAGKFRELPLHFGEMRQGMEYKEAPNIAEVLKERKTINIDSREMKSYTFRSRLDEEKLLFQVSHGPSMKRKGYLVDKKEIFIRGKNAAIELDSVKIFGPFHSPNINNLFAGFPEEKQPRSKQKSEQNPKETHEISRKNFDSFVRTIASKAFRCSEDEIDVESYFKYYNSLGNRLSFRSRLPSLLCSILLSPRFLYFKESPNELNNREIASRLANFLWGRSPDNELLKSALEKKLVDSDGRAEALKRMLKKVDDDDNKFTDFFVHEFPYQWLDLVRVGETTPSPLSHPEYNEEFEKNMVQETLLFFKEIFDKNESIFNLIESDWTMINTVLAKNYDIKSSVFKDKDPTEFIRYKFKNSKVKSYRGGLIGQASYLAITSNGTTTRPVWRGAWLAKKLLGHDLTPPPSVPTIDIDTQKANSLVQLMRVHKNNPGCKACHQRFDSLGIALEKLDVIGKVRNRYWIDVKKTLSIDTKAVSPDGKTIRDPDGVRKYLLKNKNAFTINLMTKMLEYATGRKMNYLDKRELDTIAISLLRKHKSKLGFRDLLYAMVKSKVFISK